MRAKKLRTKVVGLVAAVMVVGAPLTAWAIDVAGGDLYYNGEGKQTPLYIPKLGVKQVLVATTW
ncbi:hypothetical protein [Dorea sp. BIOML-A1]|uniref:hypothetical protein n=1 Tax=Dorea sp. BIOML-A1 TaxID=2584637 RepID=UPI001FAA2878|nr:hypothetical protein [Dorea sp. BIOML-A1]